MDAWTIVALVAALLPVAVAAGRAVTGHWGASYDDAILLVRARDVLTSHHPFIGTMAGGSAGWARTLNHPGPLYYELIALPARAFGDVGMAVGAAVVNMAFIGLTAWQAWRIGGRLAMHVSLLAATALGWTLGSEVLVEPFQPDAVLFAFLFFLTSVWGVAAGRLRCLPWAVAAGSLLMQTHLSYALLVPGLLGAAGAGLVVGEVLDRRRGAGMVDGAQVRRSVLLSAGIGVLLWAQPLYDQVWGRGNLGKILAAGDQPTLSMTEAARTVARTAALPPFWVRPTYGSSMRTLLVIDRFPSPARSVGSLLVVAAVLGVTGLVAWRRADRLVQAAVLVSGTALALSVLSASRLPAAAWVYDFHVRWLWVVSIAWMATIVYALGRLGPPRLRGAAVWAVTGATVILGVLNLPYYDTPGGQASWRVTAVKDAVAHQQIDGPVLAQPSSYRALDFTAIAELQEMGVDFTFEDETMLRHYGEDRRERGRARWALFSYEGEDPPSPPGARRIADVPILNTSERAQLRADARAARAAVARSGIHIPSGLDRTIARQDPDLLATLRRLEADPAEAVRAFDRGELLEPLSFQLVGIDGIRLEDSATMASRLQHPDARYVLFLQPLSRR